MSQLEISSSDLFAVLADNFKQLSQSRKTLKTAAAKTKNLEQMEALSLDLKRLIAYEKDIELNKDVPIRVHKTDDKQCAFEIPILRMKPNGDIYHSYAKVN